MKNNRKVIILDTSIICVWLQVPGKETCGPDNARWTHKSVVAKIEEEIHAGSTLILPFAAIIETGNHIAQARGDRHSNVNSFIDKIEQALDWKATWDAFTQQASLIGNDELKRTLNIWRETAITGQSLGDAMIVEVAKYYLNYGATVEIFTGDEGLKAYESTSSSRPIPRRRR